jgi:hypothetical protein
VLWIDIGPLAEIDADLRRPAQHRQQVDVGNRERIAYRGLLAGKLLVDPVDAILVDFLSPH